MYAVFNCNFLCLLIRSRATYITCFGRGFCCVHTTWIPEQSRQYGYSKKSKYLASPEVKWRQTVSTTLLIDEVDGQIFQLKNSNICFSGKLLRNHCTLRGNVFRTNSINAF